ncbi:MAG: GNAT family N-acetyltransferase [bacterium]
MKIKRATESDLDDVLYVERQAFGEDEGPEIIELVKGLLNDPTAMPLLSLLAISDDRAIGHILFTKACLRNDINSISSVILAPLAVIPDAQGEGVGGQLIKEGVRLLSETDNELVFVLGHPDYYPRYGFKPACVLGFIPPYPIPVEHSNAWMVQELRPGVIGSVNGKVRCADALDQPEYWRE